MIKNIIVWDLGATKCAIAVVTYDTKTQELITKIHANIKLTACHSLSELIQNIEKALHMRMQDADAICIGAAGIFDGDYLNLEAGYPYEMPLGVLAKSLKWPRYAVIHDYAPIVCSTFTPHVEHSDAVKKLNNRSGNPLGRRVALGVGTGLGLKDGVLFPDGNFWLGTNEMGHIGICQPPRIEKKYQDRHEALINYMIQNSLLADNETVTFEKILSGKGMLRLHHFLHPENSANTPEEMGAQIQAGKAPDTLALFAWYLGLFVGTVQLALMPDGGIWMTGGVVSSYLELFDHAEFWQGVEVSPAYLLERRQFPIVIAN